MNPFEHRHSARQGFSQLFTSQVVRASPTRLKLWAHTGGSQFGKLFHRYSVKPASMFVPEKKPSGNALEDDDGFGCLLHQGAKTCFTRAQFGCSFVDPLLQGLGELE